MYTWDVKVLFHGKWTPSEGSTIVCEVNKVDTEGPIAEYWLGKTFNVDTQASFATVPRIGWYFNNAELASEGQEWIGIKKN